MMKLRVSRSLLLLVLLLFTSTTKAESEENLDDFNNNSGNNNYNNNDKVKRNEQPSAKISTSLIVKDDIKSSNNNNTAVTKVKVSVSSSSSYEVSSGSRGNTTKPPAIESKIDKEDDMNESEETAEALPEAMELRSSRFGGRRRPPYRSPPPRRLPPPNSNRRNVYPVESPLRSKRPNRKPVVDNKREPTEQECTFFGRTVCLRTLNYPQEAILRSIRGNRDMMAHLLKDYNIPRDERQDDVEADVFPLETRFDNRYDDNEIKRRSDYPPSPFDNTEEGFTCPSQVMYARPQLARAASGVWKYIINTGEHTQTLRLEKCSKPKASCSFISDNYRSSCVQVYNYHRLLTWDKEIGLHIDIFKIPSCCSCHVHGYTELYPPLQKDPPQSEENFPGYDFTHNKDERPSSYLTKFKAPIGLDNNHVLAGNSKPIIDASSSNLQSYLLPTRTRTKKPAVSTTIPRPFDKVPHQHAPNTRAPGYKGPVVKGTKRPMRPNRPFRRESGIEDDETSNPNLNNWYDQPFDPDTDASTRIQTGNFEDEDYPEGNRRINYNYHPIIEFFEPKASMLKADGPMSTKTSSVELNDDANAWKPMVSA